jgi:phage shock protein PspC (stress-responsive transcriptional regulator)
MNGRYAPDTANAKLLGVCAGIARAAGWDPLFVRLGAIVALLAFGPIAIAAYVLAAWLGD